MILLEMSGKQLRCATAFIADLQSEEPLCTVSSRAEVLAFLVQHPDRYFFLIHNATVEDAGDIDEKDAIFCGLVKLVAKDGLLINKRFSFRT
jgi:hypothetical protein